MPRTTASSSNATDVLIVGAGPTGLTVATALAARNVRVTLIDRLAEGANTSRAAVVVGVSDRIAGDPIVKG
jgi:2-polyprenyl-6-methoxyphenol hydroxylase-like FAD-dependent oxidoreductase